MKVKDIPILEKKILSMLPITQAEVWNTLGINSRDCSSIIADMIDKRLIKRKKAHKTFLLEPVNGSYNKKKDMSYVEQSSTIEQSSAIEHDPIVKHDSTTKKAVIKRNPIVRQKALDMMPITQSEMWKKLGIGRRGGSRLVEAMLKDELIKRTKIDNTFLLEKMGEIDHKKEKDFSALLSNNRFSPCCGCMTDCDPKTCNMLDEWLM